MAKGIHKGTEFNNINETWNQNERNRIGDDAPKQDINAEEESTGRNELDQVIKKEAAEYDQSDNEERLLGGERATLNDE